MTANLNGPLLNRNTGDASRAWYNGLPVQYDMDYVVLLDDFIMVDDDQTNDWTVVKDTGASVGIEADTVGGVLLLTSTATTDNDGASIQGNEIVVPASSREIWFEARVQVSDADQMDFFVGICENFATNPEAALTSSNRIGFQIDDGNASILTKTEKVDTETSKDSEEDAVDATWVKLGFKVSETGLVEFYVNRVKVSEHTTNIPIVNMTPAVMSLSGDATGTKVTKVDYIFLAYTR